MPHCDTLIGSVEPNYTINTQMWMDVSPYQVYLVPERIETKRHVIHGYSLTHPNERLYIRHSGERSIVAIILSIT